MSDTLFPYYERELDFIRKLARDFAKLYPAAASRLLLEENQSTDPHVERLIESFALLAGRVHHKIDDEFPELTHALLGILYPHYLAPIPSLALIQFDLDPGRSQLPNGFPIERGSKLHTQPVGDLRTWGGGEASTQRPPEDDGEQQRGDEDRGECRQPQQGEEFRRVRRAEAFDREEIREVRHRQHEGCRVGQPHRRERERQRRQTVRTGDGDHHGREEHRGRVERQERRGEHREQHDRAPEDPCATS